MSDPILEQPATTLVPDPSNLPIASLAYSTPMVRRRPGILTAVGVLSIVLSCLSFLVCLIAGLEMVAIVVLIRLSPQMARMATPAPGGALTATQVMQIMADVRLRLQNGAGLNPAQSQALIAALSAPNQTMITPTYTGSPVVFASRDFLGNVTLLLSSRAIRGSTSATVGLAPTGQITVTTNPAGLAANPFSKLKINPVALVTAIAEKVASIGVAIYLFVAGILLLRESPHSRKRHCRYAVVKIVLVIIAGVADTVLAVEFFRAIAAQTNGVSPGVMILPQMVVFAIICLAYPVGLLFAMNSKTVRWYYAVAQ